MTSFKAVCFPTLFLCLVVCRFSHGQFMQQQLAAEDPTALAQEARKFGDPTRGAVVFYQPYMACTKCHTSESGNRQLGPELTKRDKETTDVRLVESILHPSKVIKKGFETVSLITTEGKTVTGLLVKEDGDALTLRDATNGKPFSVEKKDIDERADNAPSIMPKGLVNSLASRQQFLDLARYVMEISTGGPGRALELKPAPALYAAKPLPEYEKNIDHAGMIKSLNRDSFKRGEAIYNRLCINCHGTHDRPGSLPTSLRFASGKFKSGSDPYTMYQTLTKGFGMMVQQAWMVPQQKYDVIHYIREAYLKSHNAEQFFAVNDAYLGKLPPGDTRGPEPSNIVPWEQMDYGPNLVATYEIGNDASNFAYKGNAVRLDAGPGGVSQGEYWMVYDYDTLRVAAAWSGEGFINWQGINFDGRHNIHPRVVGQLHLANPTGPGWANPANESFEDNRRIIGRDKRIYGPLPRRWAHYKGMYYHGDKTIVSYTVGSTEVLELPGLETEATAPVFTRTFNIGRRSKDLILQVAHLQGAAGVQTHDDGIVVFGDDPPADDGQSTKQAKLKFNGGSFVEIAGADKLDMRDKNFTIRARVKTKKDGTIFAKTRKQAKWLADGKTFFIRGGRLAYDIGWVGAVTGKTRVSDGKWHDVAMSYDSKSSEVKFYVDGKLDGQGKLRPKSAVKNFVARIGFTSDNFPRTSSFQGEIARVSFVQNRLPVERMTEAPDPFDQAILGDWGLSDATTAGVEDTSFSKLHGKVVMGQSKAAPQVDGVLVAGIEGQISDAKWSSESGNLRLRIPAGTAPIRFTLWMSKLENSSDAKPLVASLNIVDADRDLGPLLKGGPKRWPGILKTVANVGQADGPFAIDVLTHPVNNPWFCRMRLTGFDFLPGGDQIAVSDWDGNVWLVSGFSKLTSDGQASAGPVELTWQRIASGLFQPLGVKIVDGKIFVTCRDQLCVLHDLNGDNEIDYFESFNNDHQVTDHFHEFAMGLQTDDEGNFYYAKSARHALTALVPHHGTLLKISKDGSRTDILATGFRAANGVCLNPDGTFIVTDQEGHWNPKNRINWVKPGGFYGNMFGYHDVTDSSDEAMDQPLCWITNALDRSPAELLWVDSKQWGPLHGSLLNLSYGYGKVYVVPHEEVDGQMQGGLCELPIPKFPTGTMRGRFRPEDGQLYTCGMFAWAGSQHEPGGFFRIRYTGEPVQLPIGLNAKVGQVSVSFSGELDAAAAENIENYFVKTWSLKRTANYGSKHYDEKKLRLSTARLSDDRKTVVLELPEVVPTWCMEIKYALKSADGKSFSGTVHNTIHKLRDR